MWIIIILMLVYFTWKHMEIDEEEIGRIDVEHIKRKIRK